MGRASSTLLLVSCLGSDNDIRCQNRILVFIHLISFHEHPRSFLNWSHCCGTDSCKYWIGKGLGFHGSDLTLYTIGTGIVFSFYILLFSLFILPFLSGSNKVLLSLSVTLNEIFLIIVLAVSQWAQSHPAAGGLPGANAPYVLQLFNPEFGFPWFQINFYALSGIPHWIYMMPVVANLLVGYLYIRPAVYGFRSKRKDNFVGEDPESRA